MTNGFIDIFLQYYISVRNRLEKLDKELPKLSKVLKTKVGIALNKVTNTTANFLRHKLYTDSQNKYQYNVNNFQNIKKQKFKKLKI